MGRMPPELLWAKTGAAEPARNSDRTERDA